MINDLIAYKGAPYIRAFTVTLLHLVMKPILPVEHNKYWILMYSLQWIVLLLVYDQQQSQ